MMDDTTRMSEDEIQGALADVSGERYNPHVRLGEPGEDDAMVELIEVSFAIPVYLTHEHQRMLHDLVSAVCDYPPNIPLAGVHWPSGYGAKPRWSKADARLLDIDAKQIDPDAPESGEPTFDDTVLFLETSARGFVSDEERERKVAARSRLVINCKRNAALVEVSEQQVILTCVYCGHAYPPGTPAAMHPLLTEHIAQCDKHPMKAVVEERNRLREAVQFIAELTGEALETARVGTCEEVALRHANRKAREVIK